MFCALIVLLAATTYTTGPLIQVSPTNLLAGCTADAGQTGTVSTNSQVEPWIVVNPVNSSNVVAMWQQDRWSDGGARGNIIGVSTNGGLTWQAVTLPGTTLCTGGNFQRATDPWLSFAPDGTLHAQLLALDEDLPSGGSGRNALLASRSIDGGFNWSAPATLTDTNDPNVFNDKDAITADPTDANFVYGVWDRLAPFRGNAATFTGPTIFARSTNGGLSWEPVRAINTPGKFKQTLGNQIVVLPNGTLVDLAVFIQASKKGAAQNAICTQRSLDHGTTWDRQPKRNLKTQPHSAFVANRLDVFDPETGQPLRTEEIIPATAVNPVTGALYVVWQDSRFSRHAIDEIAFAQSLDAGKHWSKPIKINLTPTNIVTIANRQAFTPSIRVAANGTICVTYYDIRFNDAGADLKTDVWAIFCSTDPTRPGNWGNELRLTDASFDFLQAPNDGGFFVGDYEGLAATGNDFLALWCQSQPGNPASAFVRRLTPAP